jgi:alkanesulfonate monooxygenase SsuD/methylene tetrahydromethanopterin reductase-like flavin-dependent oxidoreductase (luciferase family)
VRFAIHVHNFGVYADPRLIGELAGEADRAGWDGVFVADHLLQRWQDAPQPIADPWVALAAVALATERVRIGPMVTPLPRRRPWQLAGETATLDQLSGGRLILGVGSGIGEEFPPFGEEADLRRRAAMLDEGLDVLTGLWRGEPFSYRGEHYRLDDVTFLPRPVQQPRVPLWVAGHWPHRPPFRRAARWDGVFIDGPNVDWTAGEIIRPDDLRAAVEYTLAHRSSSEPFDVVIGGHTPSDPRQAADRIRPYADLGVTWWVEAVMEGFGTVEQTRQRLRQGPPRL